jgi:TRAP-type C4-dicarboxylate transport system permease large subunit
MRAEKQPMQNPSGEKAKSLFNRTWGEWLSSFPVFLLLVLTLIIGTGEMIHGQLLRTGETLFGSPDTGIQYSFLRADPAAPDCERNPNIDAQVQQQMAGGGATSDDPFGDLFGPKDPEQIRSSLLAGQVVCEEKYQFFEKTTQYIAENPSVKAYRTFETAFFAIFRFGTENRSLVLVLLILIAATTASKGYHHISLRPPASKLDYKVYSISMVVANIFLLISSIAYYVSQTKSGVAIAGIDKVINWLWIILFIFLTAISALQYFKHPKPAKDSSSVGMALLCIPLYAYMAIITGIFFLFFMDYAVGQAIYLGNLVEYSNLFLSLALFIWAGMLLKQTRVVDLFLDILRPWNFSPETLTWLLLIAAAIPTAYTGASGIFVIAAGAVIYKEVWNSGARRQYALAATALSGTLGVVLRPCLLIVVIAALNRQVTTDLLFHYGVYVFLITSTLFLLVSLFVADTKFRIESPKVAIPNMLRALVPVSPYIVITIIVIFFYKYGLNTVLNEFTAPVIMPLILIAILLFDKIRREPAPKVAAPIATPATEEVSAYLRTDDPKGRERRIGFEAAVRFATNETTGHIGALIMLMGLSVSVGGLIERTEIMHLVPAELGSILFAITLLVALLVFVGMFMDPFGAVILVSATVAPVAYANGIDPIHFWMIVLISFELAYLVPPVALNQLLTRMVVGEEEMAQADAEARQHKNFYFRYERWVLPIIVMFPALLIVAYLPYLFKLFGWY